MSTYTCACTHEWALGRGRGRERILQADFLLGKEDNAGLNPTTHAIVTWVETKGQTLNLLSHLGAPTLLEFLPLVY